MIAFGLTSAAFWPGLADGARTAAGVTAVAGADGDAALAGQVVDRRDARHERRVDREVLLALVRIDVRRRERAGARVALLGQEARVAVVAHADVQRQLARQRDLVVEVQRVVPLARRGRVRVVVDQHRVGPREAAVVVVRLVAARVAGQAAIAILLLVRIADVLGVHDVAPAEIAGLQLVVAAEGLGEVGERAAVLPAPRLAIGLEERAARRPVVGRRGRSCARPSSTECRATSSRRAARWRRTSRATTGSTGT